MGGIEASYITVYLQDIFVSNTHHQLRLRLVSLVNQLNYEICISSHMAK